MLAGISHVIHPLRPSRPSPIPPPPASTKEPERWRCSFVRLLLGNSLYYYYCCPVLNPCATAKSHPIKFINFINTNTSRYVHDDDLDEQRRVGRERGGRHHYHCELILFRFVALFSLNSCKDTLFILPLSPLDDECHPILTSHPPTTTAIVVVNGKSSSDYLQMVAYKE